MNIRKKSTPYPNIKKEYPNIKKYLGEQRLKKELEFKEVEWAKGRQKEDYIWMAYYTLKMIDTLIGKNESIPNFSKWTKETKDSKDIRDCLFELICIDELSRKNKIIIKQKNGDKVPDAFIEDEKIYVEMTNLKDIPQSIELKVNDLLSKSQERFGTSKGIHLIGINGFFEYSEKEDKLIPKKELQDLVKDLTEKVQKLDKNILCFLLVHTHLAHHPHINQFRWYRQIPYIIFNGTVDWNLLKKLVGDFDILQNK